MRWFVLPVLSGLLMAAFAIAPVAAQQPELKTMRFVVTKSRVVAPPSKPYDSVAAKMPPGPEDESFGTFRSELAVVAKGRVYAELARLVAAQGFFWDRDFSGGFDGRQPGVDNLAAAIRLEHRNGIGWIALARFAVETTATPLTGRLGIFCAPAAPEIDGEAFDRLLDTTRSQAREWAFPRAEITMVRASPQQNAAEIDMLGPELVRVLGHVDGDKQADALRAAWVRVATPTGKIGFVAPGALSPLSMERLCYGKDVFGRWRIAGFVSGGD
jgi:hypothetical protein